MIGVLAALAGGLGVVAVRETVLATPGLARWMTEAFEPVRRAGREGYSPTGAERRRLALVGTATLLGGGLVVLGPGAALPVAIAGPVLATWTVARRRGRYRRAVERGLPEIASAIADAVAGGRSVQAALGPAADSLAGPVAIEMAQVRADLESGASMAQALAGLRRRVRSARADSLCAALLSQQLAGGDLTDLLRRFATAAVERDRVVADARIATAQARFTGLLVVAMPVGAALLAELVAPGFGAGLLSQPTAAGLLAAAGALQVAGFAAIARLSRVGQV